MPYARAVLLMASMGNSKARKKLENFDNAQSEFLDWLNIPNIRQLLSGFAYLSSNPKEALPEDRGLEEGDPKAKAEKTTG